MNSLHILSACLLVAGGVSAQEVHPPSQPDLSPLVGPALDPRMSEAEALDQLVAQGPQGQLAVQVRQGTKGGPPIADVDVVIEYYHNNAPVKRTTAHVDENGVVMVDDVPLAIVVRPVVRLEHAGVTYLEAGPVMDAANPEAVVTLTVYEVTDDKPAWRVSMRHVMVQPTAHAARIAETLVVENPADRTWLGGAPDDHDRRATVTVTLPEGAHDVQLESGFHGWCCTSFTGRDLSVEMPLMPGRATFTYSYHVPVQAGRVGVRIGADARIDSMLFIVPDDGTKVEPDGVEATGVEQMGQVRARMYQAQAIEPGRDAGIVLAGIIDPAVPIRSSAGAARIVALVAGGVVACVVILVLIVRSSPKPAEQTS